MKSLTLLLQAVLQDCSTHCGTTTTRDYRSIASRVEHEGISFLTITLGNFASDFERSLELGYCGASSFAGFAKMGPIPKLFSGMVLQVFDTDGRLRSEPSVVAISCIRQVCRMWKKILIDCKEDKNLAAIRSYTSLELELACPQFLNFPDLFDQFGRVADVIWSQVLGSLSFDIEQGTLIPGHGPGATATKVLPNQKYVWRYWHERLSPYFPEDSYCYSNPTVIGDELTLVSPDQEQPVRVVFVPKTQKTPRVIAIEPACMQYTQQSLCHRLVDLIESHPLTKGQVNFTDQRVNASLAKTSSLSGSLATLDLSEASDRVHKDLVYRMLRSIPLLRDAIFACRSTRATLPNGVTIHLSKFASMGSALCFPIESMVFYTLLIQLRLTKLKLRPTARNVKLVSRNVYVYGDDIIIPVDEVPAMEHLFKSFGLKVNSTKSFSKGNFRESCGMDAYLGYDVTPTYIRRLLPVHRRDTSGLISAVNASNQLYRAGYYHAASYIEKYLQSKGWRLPYVSETSQCVGYIRDTTLTVHRYNDKLHRPEVKGYVAVVKKQDDHIDGYPALTKWFLKGLNPDKDHYLRSVGSGRLAVKVRWNAVH